MTEFVFEVPEPLEDVFAAPRGSLRYRGAFGGRGSGKSFGFAKLAAIWGYAEPLRILCTRELQVSIKESFHAELKAAIASEPWLEDAYDVGENYIRGVNGTEFIFKGLRHNIGAIKSMAQIDLCIIEEAEDVPEHAWIDLLPTIRAPGSEFWVIWNPKDKGSPVDKRFRESPPRRSEIVELNHSDNPWFPPELEEMREDDRATMPPELYAHVWEGAYLTSTEAQVLHGKWRVEAFEPLPGWDGPYFGLDFGFSQDPTAAVKVWVNDRKLYIEYEAGKVGLELDDTADHMVKALPGIEQHTVDADSARPESISFLKRGKDSEGRPKKALPKIRGVKKWPGSVEDGITHLRSYTEIIIHPRCKQVIGEARLYSYKKNKGGEVTREPIDKFNHYIDALRYALSGLIRAKRKRAGTW